MQTKNKKKSGNLAKYPMNRKINVESELHILIVSLINTGVIIEIPNYSGKKNTKRFGKTGLSKMV